MKVVSNSAAKIVSVALVVAAALIAVACSDVFWFYIVVAALGAIHVIQSIATEEDKKREE